MDNETGHLYTAWKSSEDVTGNKTANEFVEFRIIHVEEHDEDGSAVTFMACHALPTDKAMNNTSTNLGGWGSSNMKNTVMTDYVAKGLSGLTPAAIKPTKEVTTGYFLLYLGLVVLMTHQMINSGYCLKARYLELEVK